MNDVIGVRVRPRGKSILCDAGDTVVQIGDYVVVETQCGEELAKVISLEDEGPSEDRGEELPRVLRRADQEDLARTMQERREEALSKCREMVGKLDLKMKPLASVWDPGTGHLTIFFSARERVDFRGLVWKLSRALETRVELRQVGSRDEAKLIGGVGRCGYTLCCQTFLTSFSSVSIKMAKEQNLALNPMKISGICGRLLCCLGYENKEYAAVKKRMPPMHHEVVTPEGSGRVIGTNLLKETVTVQLGGESVREFPLDKLEGGR